MAHHSLAAAHTDCDSADHNAENFNAQPTPTLELGCIGSPALLLSGGTVVPPNTSQTAARLKSAAADQLPTRTVPAADCGSTWTAGSFHVGVASSVSTSGLQQRVRAFPQQHRHWLDNTTTSVSTSTRAHSTQAPCRVAQRNPIMQPIVCSPVNPGDMAVPIANMPVHVHHHYSHGQGIRTGSSGSSRAVDVVERLPRLEQYTGMNDSDAGTGWTSTPAEAYTFQPQSGSMGSHSGSQVSESATLGQSLSAAAAPLVRPQHGQRLHVGNVARTTNVNVPNELTPTHSLSYSSSSSSSSSSTQSSFPNYSTTNVRPHVLRVLLSATLSVIMTIAQR